jgi:hypothetical protein
MSSATLAASAPHVAAFTPLQPKSALGAQPRAKAIAAKPPRTRGEAKLILIDGLNLIRLNNLAPSLERLIAVATDFLNHAFDIACVFDANTRYKLDEFQGLTHRRAYETLLQRFNQHFIEVTGHTRADDVILRYADPRPACLIAGNDQFVKYEKDFPWVIDETRFIKVNAIRNDVFIGRNHVHVRVDSNLDRALSGLHQLLTAKTFDA